MSSLAYVIQNIGVIFAVPRPRYFSENFKREEEEVSSRFLVAALVSGFDVLWSEPLENLSTRHKENSNGRGVRDKGE